MDVKFEERPGYYSIVPASVRYDNRLKANEKLLYSEISVLCNKTGYCYASNEYFSKLYNASKETISRWISNLNKCGYIGTKLIYKDDNKTIDKRMIWLADVVLREIAKMYCDNHQEGIDEIINTYLQKNQEGIDEKSKENNTSINNIYNNNNNKEKNIFEYIEENFGRPLSPIEYEEIKTWEDNELTKYAIKQAVLSGIYNLKYISKILYEYEKNNIKTVQQAQVREEQHRKQKEANKNFQQPIYKTSRDKLKELEEQARIDDEREALENAET